MRADDLRDGTLVGDHRLKGGVERPSVVMEICPMSSVGMKLSESARTPRRGERPSPRDEQRED
jgi:hypothetical protein